MQEEGFAPTLPLFSGKGAKSGKLAQGAAKRGPGISSVVVVCACFPWVAGAGGWVRCVGG